MNNMAEVTEIEIDHALLDTVTAAAKERGLSAEQYISYLITQYITHCQEKIKPPYTS